MGETLRLELEPLGVKVITIIAGYIKTNFFAPMKDTFELPSTSFYRSLESQIGQMAGGSDVGENAMTAEEFGREVVRDVLAGKTGCTYSGTLGWTARWVPMFPTWFLVSDASDSGGEGRLLICSRIGIRGSEETLPASRKTYNRIIKVRRSWVAPKQDTESFRRLGDPTWISGLVTTILTRIDHLLCNGLSHLELLERLDQFVRFIQ
jgi:hypothetical protein